MLCKECAREVHQIRNNTIVGISPETSEFKTIACLLLFCCALLCVLNGVEASTVGIIFCIRAIGNNEYLGILKQSTSSPERIPLIAIDLVEGFPNSNPTPFQFYMNQWESINKNRHIITIIMLCALRCANNVLVDDLETVVMNVLLVNERNILAASIIACQNLNVIFLNLASLFNNVFVRIRNNCTEKSLPFII